MANLENEIKSIVIPTCDSFDFANSEDFNRASTAIKFAKENNLPKRCIIVGAGQNSDFSLGYKNQEKAKIDFHKELYNYLKENTDWMIGIDTKSVNSIENILYTFPREIQGKYALVSFPLHIKRFKKIIKDAKKAGKVSENLEIVYVPTSQNPKWFFYEVLSNLKYHLYGKQKYFSKDQPLK